jgi:hypothetical protein
MTANFIIKNASLLAGVFLHTQRERERATHVLHKWRAEEGKRARGRRGKGKSLFEYGDLTNIRAHRGMNQPWLANIYLMLFVTMSTVILLQLVIAVLMDQFTQV